MNKTEFLRAVANKSGATIKDTTAFYDAFVKTVQEAMKNNDKIALVGFGTFEVRTRGERTGRNPRTKETITIPASKRLSFTTGKTLKTKLNAK